VVTNAIASKTRRIDDWRSRSRSFDDARCVVCHSETRACCYHHRPCRLFESCSITSETERTTQCHRDRVLDRYRARVVCKGDAQGRVRAAASSSWRRREVDRRDHVAATTAQALETHTAWNYYYHHHYYHYYSVPLVHGHLLLLLLWLLQLHCCCCRSRADAESQQQRRSDDAWLVYVVDVVVHHETHHQQRPCMKEIRFRSLVKMSHCC